MNRWIKTRGVFLISIFSITWLAWMGISYWIGSRASDSNGMKYDIANELTLFDRIEIYTKNNFNTYKFCDVPLQQTDEEFKNYSKKEFRNIALIKVYKAASSTLSNILYRYGYNRKMSFILPQGVKLNQIFPNSPSDSKAKIIPLCRNGIIYQSKDVMATDVNYQLLNVHTLFRGKSHLLKLLPNDTFIISSVREPVKQIKSSFSYNGFEKNLKPFNIDFQTFFESPYSNTIKYFHNGSVTRFTQATDWGLWNPQSLVHGLREFGIKPGITRTELINDPEQMRIVKEFLSSVEREIDFTVIAEKFDESIIIMKNLLDLDWEDVAYLESNKGENKESRVDTTEHRNILEWNYIDFLLYDKMKEKFYKFKNQLGKERIMKEVEILSQYNERIANYCLSHKRYQAKQGLYVNYMEFEMSRRGSTNNCCKQITAQEWTYIPLLKEYMWRKCEVN